jgi:Zn finger protein HypA/HybF involved in hydrogenase expression
MIEVNAYECQDCEAIRRLETPVLPMECENCNSNNLTPLHIEELD